MGGVDWQAWLVEDGHLVIEKKAMGGIQSLSDAEHLFYCLWVADYGMNNAGDLAASFQLYPAFQTEAQKLAENLELRITAETFRLPKKLLEKIYFERFESICSEIAPLVDEIAPSVGRSTVTSLATLVNEFPGETAWQNFAKAIGVPHADLMDVIQKVVGADSHSWMDRNIPAFEGRTPQDVLRNFESGEIAVKTLLMRIPI